MTKGWVGGRPHVAGNSMGGAIALELSRRGTVRSTTVFSPAGFWTPGERRYAQVSLAALARMPAVPQPGVLRHELDQPSVTVAWGDADRLLLHGRQALRARSALPDARHVTLDAGHLRFHDCPDVVADVICDAVAGAR